MHRRKIGEDRKEGLIIIIRGAAPLELLHQGVHLAELHLVQGLVPADGKAEAEQVSQYPRREEKVDNKATGVAWGRRHGQQGVDVPEDPVAVIEEDVEDFGDVARASTALVQLLQLLEIRVHGTLDRSRQ